MTIDEAISKYRNRVEQYKDWENMKDIAEEHEQLAEWLEELKKYQSYKPIDKEFYKAGYNKAIDDFVKALEKHQQENWVDNLEYGITFDDIEQVAEQLKAGGVE